MEFFLGLDGGGTGCRAVLADLRGHEIGRAEGGPANINSDPQGALATIRQVVAQVLDGRDPAQVTACLGLAGANISNADEWLVPLLPFGRARVVHDATTSVAGAIGMDDGIVAAIGTGSVLSRQSGGQVLTIGGWGMHLGDEASGAWIGRHLMTRALHALDGLVPDSPLTTALRHDMGGAQSIVEFAQSASPAEIARVARRILDAPDDPATQEVLAKADTYLLRAIDRLQEGAALPVTFTGGLGPVFAERLGAGMELRPARGTALDGALLLARRMGGDTG